MTVRSAKSQRRDRGGWVQVPSGAYYVESFSGPRIRVCARLDGTFWWVVDVGRAKALIGVHRSYRTRNGARTAAHRAIRELFDRGYILEQDMWEPPR